MTTFTQHLRKHVEQVQREVETDRKELLKFYKHLIGRRDQRKVNEIKKNLQI